MADEIRAHLELPSWGRIAKKPPKRAKNDEIAISGPFLGAFKADVRGLTIPNVKSMSGRRTTNSKWVR